MKILLKCFFCFFLTISLFAQKKSNFNNEDFVSSNPQLHNYQLEKFYLHTNKSSYYAGEKMWLKAYIVNDTDNRLSTQTTNLHINIYDIDKNLILNKLSLVHNGTSNGDITLPKELKPGKYYIELTTQWNQNFKNNSSVFSINILDNNSELTDNVSDDKELQKDSLNIHFFADSSILLENTINAITFKSTVKTNPTKISGDIVDDTTGIIVSKIKSNGLGFGRFKLFCREGRSYSAIVHYKERKITFPIKNIQQTGFLITESVNKKEDSIKNFTLKTNKKTTKSLKNQNVIAVLHRNGFTSSIIPIKIDEKYLTYKFNFLKNNLFKGVNTISLFNENNKVIAEYSFYNNDFKKIDLEISKITQKLDSTTIDVRLKNGYQNANLSVSILPKETKVYENNSAITSSLLLAPYLEKTHINLNNYFNSDASELNIDYLLKTDIKANVFPIIDKKKELLLPENGLTIKGNVSSNIKDLQGYNVMLSSEENGLLLIEPVGKSNSFAFHNLVLRHPSKYKLALLNKSGEIVKTGFRIKDMISYKPANKLNNDIFIPEFLENNGEIDKDIDADYTPILFDDVNVLDVVHLSKKQQREDKLKKLGIKTDLLNNGFSNLFIIEEDQALTTVYDYLYKIPGVKVFGANPNKEFVIQSTRGPGSMLGNNSMTVFVDGIIRDTEFLASMNINDFIAINVNSSGAGAGINGMGGVINFYTKEGKFAAYRTTTNKDIHVSETDLGFITPSEFDNNQLSFINKLSKEYFGTVGWFPNFDIKPNTKNHLKFNNNGFSDIKVIINGIDSDGNLIFKVVDL